MNGLWGWVNEWMREYRQSAAHGDPDRDYLVRVLREVLSEPLILLQRDPERAYALLTEGRACAERLGEAGWVLFFDRYRARTLRSMGDFRRALDVAMRAAVYARTPRYAAYPQRICVQLDGVVGIFIQKDPDGYAEQIRDAFQYVEAEVSPDLPCTYCLRCHQTTFSQNLGQGDAAQTYALQALAHCRGYGSKADVYDKLCWLASLRGEWRPIQAWAVAGEAAARRSQRLYFIATFLAWQAAVARLDGDERAARRLYRAAVAQARTVRDITINVRDSFADALCLYHQAGGEDAQALAIRERQVARIAGQGLTYRECCYRLECCRLQARMGRPLEREVALLRSVAGGLAHPASFLRHLDDLEI